MILVLYNPEKNKLCLFDKRAELYQYWMGEPYCIWATLEAAIERGWEVIGEG